MKRTVTNNVASQLQEQTDADAPDYPYEGENIFDGMDVADDGIDVPDRHLVDPFCAVVDTGPLCGPVRVKVEVKDNQTTNTQVTAIMRDVGLRNYGEFNEPFFCNKAVLWAVDENGWALLACRSV